MNKNKLIVVGAFPDDNNIIYGGILKSCSIIKNSSIVNNFTLITIDSTQISNPPPNILIRSLLAIKRFVLFTYKLISEKPNLALIFTSDGFSAIEKGLMCSIASFLNCNVIIFPRAGNLISQTKNSKLMKFLIKNLFISARIFLCQGDKWKDFAIDELGFQSSDVKIINNWTATKELLALGANRNFDHNKSINLLFVGWLEEFKGVHELLEVARDLLEEGYVFNLTFAGDGNSSKKAKIFIKDNNLSNNIHLCGWVNETQLKELLSKNDIFILPSWAEGLPNSMIEAMSAGLSIIVSDVGVISDFIKNGETGLLIEPRNMQSLRNAIIDLLEDKDLRKKIAINGHTLAKNTFSSEIGIERLLSVLEEINDKK